MVNEIALYEELSMNAHPAIKTQVFDGWILRFANGYTNRANSVNMVYPSNIDGISKIDHCEKVYASQGLATVFKITPLSIDLDKSLEERGYKKITPTNLMIKIITEQETPELKTTITDTINPEWQQNYFRLNGITDEPRMVTNQIILTNIQNKTLLASIIENGTTIACGLAVIEREYVGLFDIVVDVNYRGKGLGVDICLSLMNRAIKEGAKKAYLQVVADNAPAVTLYSKIGFVDCYQYWYRVKGDFRTM